MTARPTGRLRFQVTRPNGSVALAGRSARSCGSWTERWRGCQVVDFSRLRAAGVYRIRVGRSTSPPFSLSLRRGAVRTADDARRAVPAGPARRLPGDPRRPRAASPPTSTTRAARVYAIPPYYRHGQLAGVAAALRDARVDRRRRLVRRRRLPEVQWDRLVHRPHPAVHAARVRRQAPGAAPARSAEARFGTDWLLKTWDQRRKVLYEQVGIGDGNGGSVLGDHDIWRLPQRDDGYRARSLRYIAHRPVFAANRPGAPVSPNLAGREAAAFALCAQVFRLSDPGYAHRCLVAGQTLYSAAARSWHGPPRRQRPAVVLRPSPEWRDDMELGGDRAVPRHASR